MTPDAHDLNQPIASSSLLVVVDLLQAAHEPGNTARPHLADTAEHRDQFESVLGGAENAALSPEGSRQLGDGPSAGRLLQQEAALLPSEVPTASSDHLYLRAKSHRSTAH